MDLGRGDLPELVEACRELHSLPQSLTDAQAHGFLSEFPFERIFRALASAQGGSDVDLITDTLGRLLATELGSSTLPNAMPYLEAASIAHLVPLRRLAAEEYGTLLMSQARKYGGLSGEDSDGGVTEVVCLQLVRMLSDPEPTVAATAAKSLRTYGSSSLTALKRFLTPGYAPSAALSAAAVSDALGGVVRLRVLALALELAAGNTEGRPLENGYHHIAEAISASTSTAAPSEAALPYDERLQLLRSSGLLQPLLDQLADPADALACLAALQLLEGLLGGGGGDGMAATLAGIALPQLLALVSDPNLTDAALPLVAAILHRILPEALPTATLAAALGGGNGAAANNVPATAAAAAAGLQPILAAAPALLTAVRAVLDDRGNASVAAEACGLDALGTLGQSTVGAQLVLSDEPLTQALCERALGRSPHSEVRMAALHAVASVAGLERAGAERSREAALLLPQCEEGLRQGMYGACGLRRPGEVLAGMLQQPFLELKLAAYRCIAALSLRSWFAVELVTTPDLYDRITDTTTESGAAACSWRHAAAASLWSTVSSAAAAANNDAAFISTLAAPTTVERVRAVVRAGPYGAEGDGTAAAAATASRMHGEHFVASRGAGGGA
ncbi:hypothetical protein VaNZ11_006252 [Volvox africanus]|uniref:26S proteasome non-ATPase regulatory subunit 5 n=1 Tax=Volvox africanus TaxID=51714 RepID=A0ABQ5S1N2_9CHLO|nr:hypothetical protein VaNZ11_006252 [Volvox africanus]